MNLRSNFFFQVTLNNHNLVYEVNRVINVIVQPKFKIHPDKNIIVTSKM